MHGKRQTNVDYLSTDDRLKGNDIFQNFCLNSDLHNCDGWGEAQSRQMSSNSVSIEDHCEAQNPNEYRDDHLHQDLLVFYIWDLLVNLILLFIVVWDQDIFGSEFIVITYSCKEVYPQHASLASGNKNEMYPWINRNARPNNKQL